MTKVITYVCDYPTCRKESDTLTGWQVIVVGVVTHKHYCPTHRQKKSLPTIKEFDASKITAADLDASKITATPVTGPDFSGTCPRCGHGKHDNTFCAELDGNTDCKCTYPERAWIDG